MNKKFELLSSDEITIYVIEFSMESGRLHVYCGCPAGILGKWCKHKLRLLSGDVAGLVGGSGTEDVTEVLEWIGNSEFPRLLDELKLAENEMQIAKAKIENAKKALEKAAQKGVNVSS